MPHTIAHIGFSRPIKQLLKQRVDLEVLCVASIVPDLDIILSGSRFHWFTFSWSCILFVLFPLSILLLFIWKKFIKTALFYFFNWNSYHVESQKKHLIILSLSLGIGVHLLLDMITHYDNYLVITNIFHVNYYSFMGKVLDLILLYVPQALLSLWGLYLFFQLFPKKINIKQINTRALAIPVAISILVFGISFSLFKEHSFFFDHIILSSTCGITYAVLFCSILFYIVKDGFKAKYFRLIY